MYGGMKHLKGHSLRVDRVEVITTNHTMQCVHGVDACMEVYQSIVYQSMHSYGQPIMGVCCNTSPCQILVCGNTSVHDLAPRPPRVLPHHLDRDLRHP